MIANAEIKIEKTAIKLVEEALQHHLNYNNPNRVNGKYLRMMDSLSFNYTGAPAQKISGLLDDYFKEVQVQNLSEAIIRLQNKENKG